MDRSATIDRLRGCFLALPTLYHDDLGLNLEGMRDHVQFLVANGLREGNATLLVNGAGGEFPVLDLEERRCTAETVVKAADGRVGIIVGAQTPSGRDAVALAIAISGLVIAGLFAAAMSSLDSSMNSMATAITTDFYRRFRADVSDHHCLNLARWLTILLGVLGTGSAIIIAYLNDPSMWDQYTKILGLFGGGLAGLFAAGIFTRRTNGAGIVVGFVVSGVILYFVGRAEAVHFFLYAAIGIVTCFVVGYLASWVLPGKPHTDGLTVYTVKR